MEWNKCSETMPGEEYDLYKNEKMCASNDSGFLVCYYYEGDEPWDSWICRANLENGRFIVREFCHTDACPDIYQKEWWKECIVTHWAHIYWPDDVAD
jgi:hypothetical protein